MKHRIITLVILLAVSLLGALDAELTELSYIDCNFQPKYSYLDSNNTLNLYTYIPAAYADEPQYFSVKRLHADGTEDEEQVLFDFNDIPYPGSGTRHNYNLFRAIPQGDSHLFLFYNAYGLYLLKQEGDEVESRILFYSSLDDFDSTPITISPHYFLVDESIYILGQNNDSESCLWKWDFEAETNSFFYTIPDDFTDGPSDLPYVALMGEYFVISTSRNSQSIYGLQPLMVLDFSLNSTIYQVDMGSVKVTYEFDSNTFYANWYGAYSVNSGVLYIDEDSFEVDAWAEVDDMLALAISYDFSLAFDNSIFGAWHNVYQHIEQDYKFILVQMQPNGQLQNYTDLQGFDSWWENYDYAFNLQGNLLLIKHDEGFYFCHLADMAENEFANWPEGNIWLPDLEGYTIRSTTTFNNDNCIVFKFHFRDGPGSYDFRYYFLTLEQTVSNSDLVQSPALFKAYPNPFMDSVKITSSKLSEADDLSIYNLKGQKVKTLAATGSDYTWDGCDENGKRLGAGIYFLKGGLRERPVKIIKLK